MSKLIFDMSVWLDGYTNGPTPRSTSRWARNHQANRR